MKKQEAIDFIISLKGYLPHSFIFEIYNDNDEIPQGIIDTLCMENKTRDYTILVGEKLYDKLKNFDWFNPNL